MIALAAGAMPAGSSTAFEIVRALVTAGHFDEARAIGRRLSGDPRLRRLNGLFVEALIHKRKGELQEAAALMRTVLDENPAFARVRQELAHTLFLLGETDASRHHFEFLSRTVDNQAQTTLYDRYLMAIRSRRPWTLEGSIGLAPSTNINNATRGEIVHIGGIPFRTHATEMSGIGLSYHLAGTYRFDIDRDRSITVGAAVGGVSYRKSTFDRMLVESFAELSARLGTWRLSAGVSADRTLMGWEGYRWGTGPYVAARRDMGRKGVVAGRLSWKQRGYDQVDVFDGSETDLSLQYRYAFSPTLAATAGLHASQVKTRFEFHDYVGVRPQVAVDYAVNPHLVLHANLAYEHRTYGGNFPLTGKPRRDGRLDLGVAATLPRLSFGDFVPRVSYGFHDTRSNVGLYERRNHSMGLSITRKY